MSNDPQPVRKHPMPVRPKPFSGFNEIELRHIVARLYPDFGSMQIEKLPRYSLIELIEAKRR